MTAVAGPDDPQRPRATAVGQAVTFGRMIKFSHTIFALPFALAAAAIAARGIGLPLPRLLAITLAMAGARTAAMGFNRIVDRHLDARNPRTAGRELPAGKVSLHAAWALTLSSAALFVGAAAYLGPLCLALSPVALGLLFGYSFTKRFTFLCHLFLGLAIASGPAGAWIAVRGDFTAAPALLMVAVATWIGGFDILYAISDADFDRLAGLHSIPARFGVKSSLLISAALHVLTVAALIALAIVAGLGVPFLIGVGIVLALLIGEHAIVTPNDLSRLNVAFFSLNGYVSVIFLAATLIDIFVR
ncbi:MAG TPA: UbiA-like polyprenyltransferase [Polyangia bacterium]|jgi:4-hydroxybenzoate polyprenyltransferase|nr:UbiA-like polyprenyltransferase [Polyangia bacterium]